MSDRRWIWASQQVKQSLNSIKEGVMQILNVINHVAASDSELFCITVEQAEVWERSITHVADVVCLLPQIRIYFSIK